MGSPMSSLSHPAMQVAPILVGIHARREYDESRCDQPSAVRQSRFSGSQGARSSLRVRSADGVETRDGGGGQPGRQTRRPSCLLTPGASGQHPPRAVLWTSVGSDPQPDTSGTTGADGTQHVGGERRLPASRIWGLREQAEGALHDRTASCIRPGVRPGGGEGRERRERSEMEGRGKGGGRERRERKEGRHRE